MEYAHTITPTLQQLEIHTHTIPSQEPKLYSVIQLLLSYREKMEGERRPGKGLGMGTGE